MISLPVWMIFDLLRCSDTSVAEMSFDPFERILHSFDYLNDGSQTNQELFTAPLMS